MSGKKRNRRSSTPTPAPESSGAVADVDVAADHEIDPELFELDLETTALATSSPSGGGGGGDPEAHEALVAALSGETTEFALSVFESASESRRASVALAILDAFGPEEGASLVAEAYDRLGEAVPDLSAEPPAVSDDLELVDEVADETSDDRVLSPALEEALSAWRPTMARVTDPVAFMSDASYNQAITSGAKAENGFYTLAIGELESLRDSIDQTTLDPAVTPFESAELCRIADVATAWIHLYETLRDTGDRPRDRDGLTEEVLEVIDMVQGRLNGLAVAVLGLETLTRLDANLKDARIFVSAWAVLASDPDSSCSKPMWAAFLQTNQRYRMVLNNYGLLEERGGEKARHRMAIRNMSGTIKTEEELLKESEEAGGFMVLAMETYSYKAGDHAKMLQQIDEILDRIFDGEFETMQQAVAAARKHVGGGGASDNFYESLTAKVEAAWMAVAADGQTSNGALATNNMIDADTKAGQHLGFSNINSTFMTSAQATSELHAKDGMKEKSEQAWQQYETYRAKAEKYQRKAEELLAKGDGYEVEAAEAFAKAQGYIEAARDRMADVDVDRWPLLNDGLGRVEGKLDETENRLKDHRELYDNAVKRRQELRQSANQQQAFLDNYNPEQVEVEVPDVFKGFETTTYGRLSLSVGARIPGTPIWLSGGASTEFGIMTKNTQLWGYNRNDWNLTATLDLFLLKITGAYVAGSYVEARNKLTPVEVIEAGEDERARYAAMRDIASKKPEEKLASAQLQGAKRLTQTFGDLKDAARGLRTQRIDRSAWKKLVVFKALEAKSAQSDLMAETFFVFNSITSVSDSASLALLYPSPDAVYTAVIELAEVDDEQAEGEVDAQRDSILTNNAEPVKKTQDALGEIANYKNNKDVFFEDYGGWEWGIEAGTSSYNASLKVRHVTVKSNGRGEKYNFNDVKRETVTGGMTMGDYSASVAAEWDDGVLSSIMISGSMVLAAAEFTDKEADEFTQLAKDFDKALRNGILKGASGGSKAIIQAVIKSFKERWSKPLGKLGKGKMFNVTKAGDSTLKIGFDYTPSGSALHIGLGHVAKKEYSTGMFNVSATAEFGQQRTIRF